MTWALRQSTASQEIPLGPFVDSTDGNTAETALTIANTDIKIQKAGATTQTNKNSGGATHIATGDYYAVLDATDTDTVGSMRVKVHVAGALPVWLDCHVYEEAVYDDLFAASAGGYLKPTTAGRTLDVSATGEAGIDWANIGSPTTAVNLSATNIDVDQVVASVSGAVASVTATVNANMVQISGDTTAADNLETMLDDTAGAVPWNGIADQGTAQAATATTIQLRAAASFGDDTPIGMTVMALGSTQGYWQSRLITDYVSATDTATVETWGVTPSGTITYKILATAPGAAGSGLDAAGVRAAIGLASANLDTQLSGLDGKLDTIDNFVDTEVATIVTQTGAAAIRTAVGLASANLDTQLAKLDTIDDFLDTEVAAIKAKTDNLPSDPADASDIAAAFAVTNGKVDAVDDLVDTELAAVKTVVDSIKTKTDSLTFTVANVLDANVQRINDVTIVGDGSGTPFQV
jgi:hypothetical protein